jgi:peptide subunit release factor 1 (eRF1)
MASDRFTYDFREKSLVPRPSGTQDDVGSPVTHGSNRDRFEDKIDEYIAKFHRDVAKRIREWLRDHGDRRVVLGGSPTAAHAVEELLHEDVRRYLVRVMSIPMHLSDSEVMDRVQPVGLEYEREKERELVEDVIDKAKAHGGRGALGLDDVKQALEFGQVELLVIAWPQQDQDALNDLLLDALNNGVKVEFVHGEAANLLKNEGGIAARLYYAVQESE